MSFIVDFVKKLLGIEKVYVCKECGMKFTSRRAFMLHKGNHETESVNRDKNL